MTQMSQTFQIYLKKKKNINNNNNITRNTYKFANNNLNTAFRQ